jgi:hypothetical protein
MLFCTLRLRLPCKHIRRFRNAFLQKRFIAIADFEALVEITYRLLPSRFVGLDDNSAEQHERVFQLRLIDLTPMC